MHAKTLTTATLPLSVIRTITNANTNPNPNPILDPDLNTAQVSYTKHAGKNAYSGNGAVNIDSGPVTKTLTACQQVRGWG